MARIAALIGLIGFLLWGALVPRPMAKLVPHDPDVLLVDFHSHTRYSHDGRPSFSPERNMEWHRLQGFHAGFITDHNRVDGALEAKELSRQNWQQTGYRSLLGEEVSLFKTHLVVLGVESMIDHRPFDGAHEKITPFIQSMKKRGLPVVASLPEYWAHGWPQTLDALTKGGISGFEIISGAPKALDFPRLSRDRVAAFCRERNIFITGISDNHGFGYATPAWNAMKIARWRTMGPDALEKAIIRNLQAGYSSVQVLERDWRFWKSIKPSQALSITAWIWLLWGLGQLKNGRKI